MKKLTLTIFALGFLSLNALAAETYSVRTCSIKEAEELDSRFMDQIKSNNFSDGDVETAVELKK